MPFDKSYFLGSGSSYFYHPSPNFNPTWLGIPGYDDAASGNDWSRGGFKLGDFRRPSEAFLFGDSTGLAYHEWYRLTGPSGFYWHSRPPELKANIVFMDGHVQYIEIRDAGSWPSFTWYGR